MSRIYLNSLILLCLLSLTFCTPEKIQVDLNAPILPGQLNSPENSAKNNNDQPKGDLNSNEILSAHLALAPNCDPSESESPSSNAEKLDNQDNGNNSLSELDEARKRDTGLRSRLMPGEKIPAISIDYGPMYFQANDEEHWLSPAFKGDPNFLDQKFTVPERHLDGEYFRFESQESDHIELHISVSSPEFGMQNCTFNEFCEDSEENYQSDLYLLRYNSELLNKLKTHPVETPLYADKRYTVYALSPKFKRFCNNQSAALNTLKQQDNASDQALQNIDLNIQQASSLTFKTEQENAANFETYFSKGKDNQAIIYFISDKVWYIALAQQ